MLPLLISLAFAFSVALTIVLIGSFRSQEAAQSAELGDRLARFRTSDAQRHQLHDPNARFSQRVVKPLVRKATGSVTRFLPSQIEERVQGALVHAGLRVSASQLILVVVILGGFLPILFAVMLFSAGQSPRMVMIFWLAMTGFGVYGPRLWVSSKIKSRKKEIWKSLPDAFDLVTASVEAGLGIDAALTRVAEKTRGPFNDELRRALQEISMGRSRRDALKDLGERTGVEELQSFINAIIQAETMGVAIGNVIRVQTGTLRTKRRQKAEEQAFKAPIKMVFPLVFFIFPSIFIVIGGPAAISLKDGF